MMASEEVATTAASRASGGCTFTSGLPGHAHASSITIQPYLRQLGTMLGTNQNPCAGDQKESIGAAHLAWYRPVATTSPPDPEASTPAGAVIVGSAARASTPRSPTPWTRSRSSRIAG